MLKNILSLKGAQKISKSEQKEINGGTKQMGPFYCACENGSGGAWVYSHIECVDFKFATCNM